MSKMKTEIKVGDTFRVFEVVNPMFESEDKFIGKQSLERKSVLRLNYLFISDNIWDIKHELKQVGTIRIKSLKDK